MTSRLEAREDPGDSPDPVGRAGNRIDMTIILTPLTAGYSAQGRGCEGGRCQVLVFCSLALGFLGKRLCFVVRCLPSVVKCLLCSEARALVAEIS